MTVSEIYEYINEIAPFKNKMQSDNSGFLAGDINSEVRKVLVCLDATCAVVREAVEQGCNLIIAHHPLIYRPVSKIISSDALHILIEHKINLIAAHTNLDVACGGVADILLDKLGFTGSRTVIAPINPDGTGFGRAVTLEKPLMPSQLASLCKNALGCSVVRYIDTGKPLPKIGLTSGTGSDLLEPAIEMGCDAFICGDLKHKDMILAANLGVCAVDAGHFHTEDVYCEVMVNKLKARFYGIEVQKAANSTDICSYIT